MAFAGMYGHGALRRRRPALGLLLAVIGLGPGMAAADPAVVGEVLFAKGVATAHRAGIAPRVLGRGEPLYEGDVLTTSASSYLIVKTTDQGEMTLRPGTVFTVARYRYEPGAAPGANGAILRLLQGGLRALTGLLSKDDPQEGMRIETPVATLGIRGTDFDARLCRGDCAAEAVGLPPVPERVPRVVGRVAFVKGMLLVHGLDGRPRQVAANGPLYQGDDIETDEGGYAVLAFTDGSRVTLRASSRLPIEAYAFEPEPPAAWQITLRLLRGSLRALTGVIGKRRPDAVRVETPVAAVGIRGTGFDLICGRGCAQLGGAAPPRAPAVPGGASLAAGADQGLFVYAWRGVIWLERDGTMLELPTEGAAFVPPAGEAQRLTRLPPFLARNPDPRPDRVPIDQRALFGSCQTEENRPGLFVTVRSGEVLMETAAAAVSIGGGESGFVALGGDEPQRLERTPSFMQQDRVPRPYQYDPQIHKILDLVRRNLKPGPADEALECEVAD